MSDGASPDSRNAEVPWLTHEQQLQWAAVMAMLVTVPPALDAQLRRDAGLNVFEYHVLVALAQSPDRTLVLSDLAVLAQGSLSRLSHAVTRLERAGWVERQACPGRGGRTTEARLTDDGFAKLEASAHGHVRETRRLVIDALSADQLAALADAAHAVVAAAVGEDEVCRGVPRSRERTDADASNRGKDVHE